MRLYITNRARNIIVAVLFLFIAIFIGWNVTVTKSVINKPFSGFLLLKNNLVPVVFLPRWEAYMQGLKFGDILVAVEGREVSKSHELRKIVADKEPGKALTYTFLRKNRKFDLTVPVTLLSLRDFLVINLVWMICGTAYYLLGLTVFFLRPNLRVSRAFLFMGVASGLSMVSNPGYCIDNSNNLSMFLLMLLGPSVLIMSLYFPVELKEKTRRYMVASQIITIPVVIFLHFHYFYDLPAFRIADSVFIAHLAVTFGLGVFIMAYSFATSDDAEVRLKGRIVIFGFVVCAIGGGLGLLGSMALKVFNFFWLFIPFAAVPLTVGYAIAKHNLFDVDVLIRRSTSYLAVSAIVLIASFLLLTSLSFTLQLITGKSSAFAAIITIFIMLVIFNPLKVRVDRLIERLFFGEVYEYQQTIRKAGNVLNSIIEMDELLKQILDTMINSIKIKRGIILLREEDEYFFKPSAFRDYSDSLQAGADERTDETLDITPIGSEHPLFINLERHGKPLQLNDIRPMVRHPADREAMLEVMMSMDIVLIVPIIFERQMIGALGLGPKITDAWYSTEDIELLQTLMVQTAVSIDNARKVEELKRMVELETSYRELKKIDEMKDNFLAMVSHDLRTPMTGIKAHVTVMREKLGRLDEEKQKKYLDTIIRQSNRLTVLINDLLDMQRFEAGKMTMEFESFNLIGLILESMDSFQAAAEYKKLALKKNLPDHEILIHGHSDRLAQVLANLLSNALKFTPEGGRISVTAEKFTDDGKSGVRVSVSDTGPGIPKHMHQKIFDKFEQAQQPSRESRQGTGLGLALVREIVEYHGGKVGLDSELERGSIFYFTLDIKEQEGK